MRRYRYYVCNKPPNGNRDPCPAPSLPAVALERYVVAEVQKALGRPNGNGETGDPRKLVRDHVARVDYDGRSGAIAITLRSEEDGP